MQYRLLLTNVANGDEAEIIVPARMPLEDLTFKIQLELGLKFVDNGWHRYLSRGTTYVLSWHVCAEPDFMAECDDPLAYRYRYRSSEEVRLNQVFTVLNSVVTYIQDASEFTIYKVRCTLLERIF